MKIILKPSMSDSELLAMVTATPAEFEESKIHSIALNKEEIDNLVITFERERSGRKTRPRISAPSFSIKSLPPNPIPVAYAYGRVSRTDQYERDSSIPAQKLRAENYYRFAVEARGIRWGGFIEDGRAVSAREVSFFGRPSIQDLLAKLRPGDHIIFDKIDRFSRDTLDFLSVMEWFKSNNITVHIMSFNGVSFEQGTSAGGFFLTLQAGLSQFEADQVSERMKEAHRHIKRRGHTLYKNSIPTGTKSIPIPGKKIKQLVWDVEKRKAMAMIVHLRDDRLLNWANITWAMELRRQSIVGGPLPRDVPDFVTTQHSKIRRMYQYEIGYRKLRVFQTCQIPHRDVILAAATPHEQAVKAKICSIIEKQRLEKGIHPGLGIL